MTIGMSEGDTSRRLQIMREGAAAKQEGKDRTDNPYASPDFREFWFDGFDHPEMVSQG